MRFELLSTVKTRNGDFSKWVTSDGRLLLIFGLLTIAALIPLTVVQMPPLADLPNHLARIHILMEIDKVPALARNYVVQWEVIPGLVVDLALPALARFMTLEDAARVFVGLVLVVNVAGVLALHYAVQRRLTLAPALVFLVLYNESVAWGLLNFLFGLGVALMLFAGWICTQHWRPMPRLGAFSVGALVLFFCHLLALASYGLLILGFEAWRLKEDRRFAIAELLRRGVFRFGQFVLPALLVLLVVPHGEVDGYTGYGTLLAKVMAITSPFRFYLEPVDILTTVVGWGVLGLGLLTNRIGFAPELRYPMILVFVVAMLLPRFLMGIFGVDERVFVLFMFLTAAALQFRIERRSVLYAAGGIALALFAWRIATTTAIWRDIDARFAEFRNAVAVIDEGARLLSVQRADRSEVNALHRRSDMAYLHVPSFATIERSAFVPLNFTLAFQPIKAHPGNAALDTLAGRPITYVALREGMSSEGYRNRKGTRPYYADWPAHFDYVSIVDFGSRDNPAPEVLQPVRRGSFFTIYENTQRWSARR